MSWLEHIRTKYRYNDWANEKVYFAAAGLTDDQLAAERAGTSYGTLASDLTHLASVQHRWSTVVTAHEMPDPVQPPASRIVRWLQERLAASEAALQDMIAFLTDENLDATITRERDGETYQWVRWRVVEHIANHSAHHRAEIGQVLHTLGASPGDLDFIFFVSPD